MINKGLENIPKAQGGDPTLRWMKTAGRAIGNGAKVAWNFLGHVVEKDPTLWGLAARQIGKPIDRWLGTTGSQESATEYVGDSNTISLDPNLPTIGAATATTNETIDADRIAREEAAKKWIQHTVEAKKQKNLPISEDLATSAGVQPTYSPTTTPPTTPSSTPVTKPAPRPLSTPEAIPTPSMEDLPTLDDYKKTVSGLTSDFSAKLAAARKPFDKAVAKFDQEPSIENVPMSNRDQIRSIRRNARNDIKAIRRGQ